MSGYYLKSITKRRLEFGVVIRDASSLSQRSHSFGALINIQLSGQELSLLVRSKSILVVRSLTDKDSIIEMLSNTASAQDVPFSDYEDDFGLSQWLHPTVKNPDVKSVVSFASNINVPPVVSQTTNESVTMIQNQISQLMEDSSETSCSTYVETDTGVFVASKTESDAIIDQLLYKEPIAPSIIMKQNNRWYKLTLDEPVEYSSDEDVSSEYFEYLQAASFTQVEGVRIYKGRHYTTKLHGMPVETGLKIADRLKDKRSNVSKTDASLLSAARSQLKIFSVMMNDVLTIIVNELILTIHLVKTVNNELVKIETLNDLPGNSTTIVSINSESPDLDLVNICEDDTVNRITPVCIFNCHSTTYSQIISLGNNVDMWKLAIARVLSLDIKPNYATLFSSRLNGDIRLDIL